MKSNISKIQLRLFILPLLISFVSGTANAQTVHTLSPGARSNGMAESSTAVVDAYGAHFNPGSMGIYAFDNSFTVGHSLFERKIFDTDFLYQYSNIFLGADLGTLSERLPVEMAVGLEYHRQHSKSGPYEMRDENNNYLGTYEPTETGNNFGLSLGFRYLFELGLGVNFFNLSLENYAIDNDIDKVYKYRGSSWGVLLRLPLKNAIRELTGNDFDIISDPFKIEVTPAIGNAKLFDGLGFYKDDDLPGVERFGYSLKATIDYNNLPLLGFLYARDFADDPYYTDDKKDGLGHEISFMGFYQFRWGRNTSDSYYHDYQSDGFSLRSKGLTAYSYEFFLKDKIDPDSWQHYLISNLDVSYSWSNWDREYINFASDVTWWQIEFSL